MLVFTAACIFCAYLFTYFAYGLLFRKITGKEETGPGYVLTAGMFLYSLAFLVFVPGPKYFRMPLHLISRCWMIVWIGSVILILILLRREAKNLLREAWDFCRNNRLNTILFLGFTLFQVGFDELYGRWSSSNNPSNYVAYVTTAVFTDELGTTHPVTGRALKAFATKMFTETYMDHSAVIAKLFHVHPLIEIRWVVPAIFLVMGNMVVAVLARSFFEERAKRWLFFAGYQAAVACTTGSYLFSSFYTYFRNYEGKTVISAVILPVMFYVFWRLYRDPCDRNALVFGVICIAGSFHFTGTALFLIPVACLGLVPAIASGKQLKRMILNAMVLILPCIVYAAFYAGVKLGLINLMIR